MPTKFKLNTKQFAQLNNCAPGTIRRHHSDWGHFHGVRPVRLENGDLAWPVTKPEQKRRNAGGAV